jgi:peroxiredoxin
MKIFQPWGLLIALASLMIGCGADTPPVKLNTGDRPPAFQSSLVQGSAVTFPENYVAQPLVVRFWADWCHFCEGEMKANEQVYQRLHPQGLQMIAINVGQDRKTVAAFMRKIGVSYPALMDENAAVARRWGVVGLPTTYFIGRDGTIHQKVVGEMDSATFAQHAETLLR